MDEGVCYFESMGSFYNVSTIVEPLLQYVANFTLSLIDFVFKFKQIYHGENEQPITK